MPAQNTYPRPPINVFHIVVSLWALANTGYLFWFESSGADSNASFGTWLAALSFCFLPAFCILVAIMRYRAGTIPAVLVQILFTFCLAADGGHADMRGAPQALGFVAALLASPLILWWANHCDRKRRDEGIRYY